MATLSSLQSSSQGSRLAEAGGASAATLEQLRSEAMGAVRQATCFVAFAYSPEAGLQWFGGTAPCRPGEALEFLVNATEQLSNVALATVAAAELRKPEF